MTSNNLTATYEKLVCVFTRVMNLAEFGDCLRPEPRTLMQALLIVFGYAEKQKPPPIELIWQRILLLLPGSVSPLPELTTTEELYKISLEYWSEGITPAKLLLLLTSSVVLLAITFEQLHLKLFHTRDSPSAEELFSTISSEAKRSNNLTGAHSKGKQATIYDFEGTWPSSDILIETTVQTSETSAFCDDYSLEPPASIEQLHADKLEDEHEQKLTLISKSWPSSDILIDTSSTNKTTGSKISVVACRCDKKSSTAWISMDMVNDATTTIKVFNGGMHKTESTQMVPSNANTKHTNAVVSDQLLAFCDANNVTAAKYRFDVKELAINSTGVTLGSSTVQETSMTPVTTATPATTAITTPKILRAPKAPGAPEIPSTLSSRTTPLIRETPGISNTRENPGIPGTRDTSGIPDTRKTLWIPSIREIPGVPSTRKTPGIQGIRDTPAIPITRATLDIKAGAKVGPGSKATPSDGVITAVAETPAAVDDSLVQNHSSDKSSSTVDFSLLSFEENERRIEAEFEEVKDNAYYWDYADVSIGISGDRKCIGRYTHNSNSRRLSPMRQTYIPKLTPTGSLAGAQERTGGVYNQPRTKWSPVEAAGDIHWTSASAAQHDNHFPRNRTSNQMRNYRTRSPTKPLMTNRSDNILSGKNATRIRGLTARSPKTIRSAVN